MTEYTINPEQYATVFELRKLLFISKTVLRQFNA